MPNPIDVAQCISELLYARDTVFITDFGAFISTYKPSEIDYVEGLIYPPSKSLDFNEAFKAGDQVLVDYIVEKYGVHEAIAENAVQAYVDTIQKSLDEKDIVKIPKIGRFYVDFERHIQFLQDKTNYNTEVYGLPVLSFEPIYREKEKSIAPVSDPETNSSSFWSRNQTTLRRALPSLIVVLTLGTVLLLYSLFFYNPDNALADDFKSLQTELKLNQKPDEEVESPTSSSEDEIEYSDEDVASDMESLFKPRVEEEKDLTPKSPRTRNPKLGPGHRECIIIIGQFSQDVSIRKSIKAIKEVGFDVYTDINPKNNLTRVGVQFIYEDPEDVQKALAFLREKFEKGSFVWKE